MVISKVQAIALFELGPLQLKDLLVEAGYDDLGEFIRVRPLGMNSVREVVYSYEYGDSLGGGQGRCYVKIDETGKMIADY